VQMALGWCIAGLLIVAAGCGTAASSEGGAQDAGGSGEGGVILAACDDGTGNVDCCGPAVGGAAICGATGAQCWTQCRQGLRGHYYCSGGVWLAGHGLFPCEAGARGDARE
jgi:hypothetical protein